MTNITQTLKTTLLGAGAALVGCGSLHEVPPEARRNLPVGVSVAVVYPKAIIRGIYELPTPEYHAEYLRKNELLDSIVTLGAKLLTDAGYTAIAQTRAYVNQFATELNTLLPHKTVATRSGLGWIGKCALCVTPQYGSMVRYSSILTDAPLELAEPINESRCGDCTVCMRECPAQAVSGKLWSLGVPREEFFDAARCSETAAERSVRGFGGGETICGRCILVCPYTQKYLKSGE